MSDKYRVTRGQIIIPQSNGGGSIQQGCVVPEGSLDESDIRRLLNRGILERVEVEAPSEQTFEEPQGGGIGSGSDPAEQGGDSTVVTEGSEESQPDASDDPAIQAAQEAAQQPSEDEPAVTKGKWNVDPASIAEASLEDLLIRVHEIDPTVALDELDEESARALLSSEFEPVFQEPVAEATADQIEEVARRVADQPADAGASE